MKKRCWERSTSFIEERDWLIPGVLELMVFVVFFLLVFYFKTSLTTSAQILFSGSLVVTSFLLVRIQRAFNKHVREKDNPDLVTVGDPDRMVREVKGEKDKHIVQFTFQVCHPAPTFAALWKVHIENSELSNESWKMLNWNIEKIDIGIMVQMPIQTTLPVLVKPNEITMVVFRASVDKDKSEEASKIKELKWSFVYQIGNYKKKSTRYEREVA